MARARAKALDVSQRQSDALVIGADQVLSYENKSFDKVQDKAAAQARLSLLAGSTHTLHSAFALAWQGRVLAADIEDCLMPMRHLTAAEIAAYVATGEWQGSVGCYQYENRGVQLFNGVRSEQSSIVGLALQPLLAALRQLGINPLLEPHPPWTLTQLAEP